ncbi:MAG: ABC transporter permease [Terriglobia bacterium]|jgi:ABC-2 type transport system permease protein
MRKIWLVIKREYLTRVRTRGFVLSTVGLPLFSIGLFAFTLALANRKADHPIKISILDNLGGLSPQILLLLNEKLPDGQPRFQLVRSWDRPDSETAAHEELTRQVRDGQLDAFLEVPKDILLNGKEATLHTRNGSDYQTDDSIGRAVTNAVFARRLSDRGVHIDNLSDVMRGVELALVKVTTTGETKENDQSALVQLSIVVILYITLLVYGVMTMRSVLEEKTSRIVEILASSIKPSHLLTGKILGVAGVALTQYLIWVCTAALVSGYGAAIGSAFFPGAAPLEIHLPTAFLVYPLIFFLAGYFLYASLYAALGSMVSSDEDLQQVQMPVTLVLVACFILFPIIQRAPNSPLAVALTLFPFSSPILMVFRITVQTPPFWQIALSLAICIVTIVGVIQLSAKIYRVGILMYGKRPSLVELVRWLRYT